MTHQVNDDITWPEDTERTSQPEIEPASPRSEATSTPGHPEALDADDEDESGFIDITEPGRGAVYFPDAVPNDPPQPLDGN
jgi:hypothetical protein